MGGSYLHTALFLGLEWLFAHEAGHCLGASTFGHMKPAGIAKRI